MPGSTNTNLGPGLANTNWGQGPVNTNWEPGTVNTNWGSGTEPRAKQRTGGREIRRPDTNGW